MNRPEKVTLTHEGDTRYKSAYSSDSDLIGTLFLDTIVLKQRNGGTVPSIIRLTITGME